VTDVAAPKVLIASCYGKTYRVDRDRVTGTIARQFRADVGCSHEDLRGLSNVEMICALVYLGQLLEGDKTADFAALLDRVTSEDVRLERVTADYEPASEPEVRSDPE
jgi:hypothetical protein